MAGYERLKSVGGGGRYDALASDGRTTYPGVGISFGVSRTLVPLVADGVLAGSRAVSSAVLVALADEDARPAAQELGRPAAPSRHPDRGRRRPAEVRQADPVRRAARHPVRLVPSRTTAAHQVKDIRSGDQVDADPDAWDPPDTDLHQHVIPSQQGATLVIRTHDAGTLTAADAGQTVTLAGWVARRRDHGGVAFLDLREASGVAQVVVRDESVAHSLRSEYCVAVTGTVQLRPEGNANPNLPSGEIEVIADIVEVLSAAAPLPFPIDDHVDVGEEARLKHRYLDLRRSGPQRRASPAQQGQQGRPRRPRPSRLRRGRDARR